MARLVARAALPDPARGGRMVAAVRRWAAGLGPAVIVTLLAGAMRRADTAAIALELRGVAGPGQPTPWRVARFERDDAVFAALSGLVLATVAVLTWR
jgi:energy-coupling factor transporter transmembrane protein EcfT